MISRVFNKESGVLETTFQGTIEIKEIIDYMISLGEDKSLPKKLKIFTDATNANFAEGVTPADMKELVKANHFSLSQRFFIYDAFVVSGTLEMALGQLYQEFSNAENYKFSVFSSKRAAIEWLNMF